ncbi:MAG TPA: TonB-dependent receptor plug domain-containing protein, partial [Pyrinomonadaceae bacterium]|nr:TonB-dependent receptor plug domain-containing protein [Pyrinomonadaceae bacterium]
MRESYTSFLGALIICCVTAVATLGQGNAVDVSGQILDQNSASIGGATVVLRQKSVNYERQVATNQQGYFAFGPVPEAEYLVKVEAPGFSSSEQTILVRRVDFEPLRLVLQPRDVAESVVITSSHLTVHSQDIARIPGAIEIIEEYTLENSRAQTSTEVLRKVSGLNVRDEEGFGLRPNIGIRGLNPTRSTKVLLLEDGLPLTYAPYGDNASYYHPPIDRFESVEVLKGSGQILYGPQTVGGVVNYITRTPPTARGG